LPGHVTGRLDHRRALAIRVEQARRVLGVVVVGGHRNLGRRHLATVATTGGARPPHPPDPTTSRPLCSPHDPPAHLVAAAHAAVTRRAVRRPELPTAAGTFFRAHESLREVVGPKHTGAPMHTTDSVRT